MRKLLHLLTIMVLPFLTGQTIAQVFTATPNDTIPDNSCDLTNEFPLAVTGIGMMNGTLGLESVCLNITHPFDFDLQISLVSPDGQTVILSAANGGAGADYTNTCFDGIGTNGSIVEGTAPFTGSYLPEESLGVFNNGIYNANGTWILRVCDGGLSDVGTLLDFTLTFGNSPVIINSPANDECINAVTLTVNHGISCTTTTPGTLVDATRSLQPESCELEAYNDDVWYTFEAVQSSHFIEISNIMGSTDDLIFQVLAGTCEATTQVACHDDPNEGFAVENLSPGQSYFLRIASYATETQTTTFDVCVRSVSPPPANDECANASVVTVSSGTSCTSTVAGTLEGATDSGVNSSCPFSGNFNDDVWFSFVATETAHEISISNITGSTTDLDYQVLEGVCGSLTELACYSNPTPSTSIVFTVGGLTVSNMYYLRVASFSDLVQNSTFDVCIRSPQNLPPSNDACTMATVLPVSMEINCSTSVSGTLLGATSSLIPQTCTFNDIAPFDDDVWFSFTAQETGSTIEVSNIVGSSTDLIYEVFSGACGSLTPILCHDEPDESLNLTGLTIGNPYFVRIASYETGSQTTTFDICVHSFVAIPPNDECAAADIISVSTGQSCSTSVSGTLLGATASLAADCPASGGFNNDVWYRFVASKISQVIELSSIEGSTQDLEFQILTGNCGAQTEIACHRPPTPADLVSFKVNGLVPTNTYYIRVASFASGLQTTTFDICVKDTIPDPPVNDECASASAITVSTGTSCTSTTSGTLLGATASGIASTCASEGDFDDDVWFSFVAAEVSQVIALSNISGSTQDLDIQVNGGPCVDLTEITCHRAGTPGPTTSFEVNGLTPGNTYYIRVASFAAGMQTTSFDICVKSVDAGCSLLVTSTQNSGAGTLREAISCAVEGDTIKFDASVFNQTLSLDLPVITIDKNLVFFADFSNNITLSNASLANTDVLMSIQDLLSIHGLKIIGQTAESMIFKLESGGNLEVRDVEMDKVTVDKN